MASDGFIREVDEELQRDRMTQAWKRYGPLATSIVLAVVLAASGKVGWDAWQARKLEQQGEAFARAQAALARDDSGQAASMFASLAETQSGNVAAIAKMREAEIGLVSGAANTALDSLRDLSRADSLDPVLQDFAALAALQRLASDQDGAAVEGFMNTLTAVERPFRHSAREIAILAAIERGDLDTASSELRELQTDATTPDGVRRRAAELLLALGLEDDAAVTPSEISEDAS